jgi:hypothetical protein
LERPDDAQDRNQPEAVLILCPELDLRLGVGLLLLGERLRQIRF